MGGARLLVIERNPSGLFRGTDGERVGEEIFESREGIANLHAERFEGFENARGVGAGASWERS